MTRWIVAAAAGVLALATVAGLQEKGKLKPADGRAARGEYLVLHVAMCAQCHSPRDERGELDRARLLRGGPVPVKSPWAQQEWAFQAPSLAGLPGGWSEEQLASFLQTGKDINGRSAKPPMPPFRMTREDALAVAAYLRSLGPPGTTTTQPAA